VWYVDEAHMHRSVSGTERGSPLATVVLLHDFRAMHEDHMADNSRLHKRVMALHAMVEQYASECAECDGTGTLKISEEGVGNAGDPCPAAPKFVRYYEANSRATL
jgi:hypothetical protein